MIESTDDQFIWSQKYRPRTVTDLILPDATKNAALGYINNGRIPNLLFTGSAGQGKTTLALAMCHDVGCDSIIINASNENSIDVLRTKITQFASTASFSDSKKVIIMDESDYMSASLQNTRCIAVDAREKGLTYAHHSPGPLS